MGKIVGVRQDKGLIRRDSVKGTGILPRVSRATVGFTEDALVMTCECGNRLMHVESAANFTVGKGGTTSLTVFFGECAECGRSLVVLDSKNGNLKRVETHRDYREE